MQPEILIPAALSALVLALGSVLTYRGNTRAKRTEAEAAPYADLAQRVGALEMQVTVLLQDQWTDRGYMRSMLHAWPAGVPLPQPMPLWLAAHYGLQPMHPQTPGSIIEPPRR